MASQRWDLAATTACGRGRVAQARHVHPVGGVFLLTQVDAGGRVDDPVQDRAVLRERAVADGVDAQLLDALRRQLRADPVVQVGLADGHAVEGLADECAGVDRGGRLGLARQRRQVGLGGIEHAPEAPHAREVVLGDVAVEQELAGAVLVGSSAAFDLEVVALARTDLLGIELEGL